MWRPDSWASKPLLTQQARYPDESALARATDELSGLPPLVTVAEVERLKAQLAEAAAGRRFVLQGGDCAESFADCSTASITNKLKILLQMSLVLVHGLETPIVRIGRIAGQYAKPRSDELETRDGISLPSYRGDLINGAEFTPESRTPDPRRLLTGYSLAALTLNYIRALTESGFADLGHPENWDLDFVQHSPLAGEYRDLVDELKHNLRFFELVAGGRPPELKRVDFYTSHEALHLHFEQAMTRDQDGRWYNLSTHFPWVGMRTAQLDSAHVEYARGIANPLGLKVGPGVKPEELLRLLDVLDPRQEPGRITLIHRMGAGKIAQGLPPLLKAVQASGRRPLWIADPMHGNTASTSAGYKTRRFNDILAELEQAFALHAEAGSRLGGVHFELTGDDVTECLGGARGLKEADLRRAYKSLVDPRLNYEQALEMALSIVACRRSQERAAHKAG
ncbi:MAG: 3-deoxy-7-phosphoheptulonate synthase class II [Gammaproteobacteria bacterium]|nr:3-deoxy-7-phosphoheptulonate synthase class II [Gammaproteobacteria bacterium]